LTTFGFEKVQGSVGKQTGLIKVCTAWVTCWGTADLRTGGLQAKGTNSSSHLCLVTKTAVLVPLCYIALLSHVSLVHI